MRSAVLTILAVAIIAGCSGGPPPVSSLAPAQTAPFFPHHRARAAGLQDLAIAEYSDNSVQIFNKNYQPVETITSGVDGPVSTWYEPKDGALYVANASNGTITEYPKGSSSSSFTYASGLQCPYDVKTDRHENVYVVDGCKAIVAEYPQGINRISAECPVGAPYPKSVAVDQAGNVFVGVQFSASGMGQVQEYIRKSGALSGLSGCNDESLISLGDPTGLLFDKAGNMIACDEGFSGYPYIPPNVDIIPPPYTSISEKLGGFKGPVGSALNEKQNTLFVADRIGGTGNGDVNVVTYPGGRLLATLGASYGVTDAWGVAAYPVAKW
jgi:hypothetical protein